MTPSPPDVPSGRVQVVGAAIFRGDHCLTTQRSPQMAEPLKWEFPGGKVEPGEGPAAALERELDEELGLRIRVGHWLGRGQSATLCLDVYAAEIESGEITLLEHHDYRWIGEGEIASLDWAALDRPVLAAVRRRLLERQT